jgi:hypothetical protein
VGAPLLLLPLLLLLNLLLHQLLLLRRHAAAAAAAAATAAEPAAAPAAAPQPLHHSRCTQPLPWALSSRGRLPLPVQVGAQLRPAQELLQLVESACSGPAAAGALLMVSGSHPARSLPLVRGLLRRDSTWLLQQASALRARGALPPGTQLWAVGNPVTEPGAALLERKVAAGAQVVLTQPPLDWPAFERWMRDAEARGLTSAARLLIGVPMLTSAANAAFWVGLCGAYTNAAARGVVQEFRAREAELAGERLDEWALRWNERLVRRVLEVPGVAGLHLMPITAKGRRQAVQLMQEGALPASGAF